LRSGVGERPAAMALALLPIEILWVRVIRFER
jgi:hypothetical protein